MYSSPTTRVIIGERLRKNAGREADLSFVAVFGCVCQTAMNSLDEGLCG